MVVSLIGLNVGVVAVATALTSANITAGLGLGLFGVLSIIRIRSSELELQEVAYFFTALAMGLLGGIAVDPIWLNPVLMGTMLIVLWAADNPALFSNIRRQTVVLPTLMTDEDELIRRLEDVLGGRVRRIRVKRFDLVAGTTNVEVRYEQQPGGSVIDLRTISGNGHAERHKAEQTSHPTP